MTILNTNQTSRVQKEQKLAESIWWLVELSYPLGLDLEEELEAFLSDKEKCFGMSDCQPISRRLSVASP
ncbi:hypothetical protein E4U01_08635 [Streptococcus acidominimus]|uniref:Uncharacterized protein n=1 Tax=Streptococcus acidominimus TaxID=1326 RepID=A0A4Y9FKS4_STRAI|nr:hypothetical protein E4U01_08635 [Streptococcus acidominimus]